MKNINHIFAATRSRCVNSRHFACRYPFSIGVFGVLLACCPALAQTSQSGTDVVKSSVQRAQFKETGKVLPVGLKENLAHEKIQSVKIDLSKKNVLPAGPYGDWGIFNAGHGSASGFGLDDYYGANRSKEDWSFLRYKATPRDWSDWLKYLPLNDSGSVYLSFNANYLNRTFYNQRPQLGTVSRSPSFRLGNRFNFGADLHLGNHVRLYGELLDSDAAGINYYGYTSGSWRSHLNVQQAFVEVMGHMAGAKVGVMAGRMVFLDLPPALSGGRAYFPVPLSWNGVRGYAFWDRFRLDLFDLVQTNSVPIESFDHPPLWSNRLFGGIGSYALPVPAIAGKKSTVFLDGFYYGYLVGGSGAAIAAPSGTIAASTRRDNVGGRLWGNAGPLEFNVDGVWQGGEVREAKDGPVRRVSAFMANASALWRFDHVWSHPAVGLQGDVASGGNVNKSNKGVWSNFLSPYIPSGYIMDISTEFGMSNIVEFGPSLDFAPAKKIHIQAKVPMLWRENTTDTLYTLGNVGYKLRNISGGYTGVLPQFALTWTPIKRLTVHVDGEYLFMSHAIIRAGGESEAFLETILSYDF